ncbi:MAG: GGDEF domain-containing protein [Dehalococcoidia bacterium]
MTTHERIYDASVADGRFQLEVLALRWLLVAAYAVFVALGVIDVSAVWFAISEGFLVTFHLYYTWYVFRELGPRPLAPSTAYANPFLDTLAVTLALIAVGDPLHPIWAVYFFIIVSVSFFYYPVARVFGFWLLANYAVVGLGLHLRGLDVPAPEMGVAATILLAGVFNLATYTGGERRLRGQISQAARTDPLTNLLNRRGLEEALAAQLEGSGERGHSLAVFMVDIDRFKRYNDQFGHLNADTLLEQLGIVLSSVVRDEDIVARYGGDEFVVIIPEVAADEAFLLAERLRQQISRLGLCTVSIGVSCRIDGDASAEELLNAADAALLDAKQAGRNCVRTRDIESLQVA